MRDSLAALHGDPKRAALGEEKFELAQDAATEGKKLEKESWQRTVLDALVRLPHVSFHVVLLDFTHIVTKQSFLQVCTILSQNTTDINSHRAFTKLKDRFPTWEEVRTADSGNHCCCVAVLQVDSCVGKSCLCFR